jgi:hypothetical protein
MVVCETISNRDPRCDFYKLSEINARYTRTPFRQIGANRNGCAPHLIGQSQTLFAWKIASHLIYEIGKLNRFLPDIEFSRLNIPLLQVPQLSTSTLNNEFGLAIRSRLDDQQPTRMRHSVPS